MDRGNAFVGGLRPPTLSFVDWGGDNFPGRFLACGGALTCRGGLRPSATRGGPKVSEPNLRPETFGRADGGPETRADAVRAGPRLMFGSASPINRAYRRWAKPTPRSNILRFCLVELGIVAIGSVNHHSHGKQGTDPGVR